MNRRNKIYEKEVPVVVNEIVPDTTTIVVTSKPVQSKKNNTNRCIWYKNKKIIKNIF